MGQATWKGSAAVLTSALVLLLEGRFPSADICRFRLLWFLCCVVHGPLRHCTLPGVGPCWLTMARRYLYVRMAALRVLGPSSAWFLAAVLSMSRASSSGDLVGSTLRSLCVVVPTPYAGASSVLGRLDGISRLDVLGRTTFGVQKANVFTARK